MTPFRVLAVFASAAVVAPGQAQRSDILVRLTGGELVTVALPEFRATGAAADHIALFHRTVKADIEQTGLLLVPPSSFYPLDPPQQDSDWRAARAPDPSGCRGRCLSDWNSPPVSAAYAAFGYGAEQNGRFVVFGHLYATAVPDLAGARVFRKVYSGELTEGGARKAAHEYAADILARFGVPSLAATKIYFVSDRAARGTKEICVMDFDGANPRALTSLRSVAYNPAVSPDGKRLAFSALDGSGWRIRVISAESGRPLPFHNPAAPTNATPEFAPDSRRLLFASSLSGVMQLYSSAPDGGSPRRLLDSRALDAEPKVNPRTGTEIVYVSGSGGRHQIYLSTVDGAAPRRLTDGKGYAANPAWHPNGRFVAYAGTGGPEPGNWNIFLLDVSTGETVHQLTHGAGRNENPTWAPDGVRLAFSSTRSGSSQIWSMRADGSDLRQLTTESNNWMPAWSK